MFGDDTVFYRQMLNITVIKFHFLLILKLFFSFYAKMKQTNNLINVENIIKFNDNSKWLIGVILTNYWYQIMQYFLILDLL